MGRRWSDDAHGIDRPDQVTIVADRTGAKLLRDLVPGLRPGVDDGDQLAVGELSVLLSMKATEVADPDHGGSDFWHGMAIMPAVGAPAPQ